MKKTISFLLSLIMLISAMPVTVVHAAQNTWNPSGNVYDISTTADFRNFAQYLNDGNMLDGIEVNLLQDIDFAGEADYSAPSAYTTEFHGIFNGNNKTIKNISVINTDGLTASLFTSLGEDAVIRDLTIDSLVIKKGARWNAAFVAICWVNDAHITNCRITGNSVIQSTEDFKSGTVNYTAGYVAEAQAGKLTIDGCTVDSSVIINGRGARTYSDTQRRAGAFIGDNNDYSSDGGSQTHTVIKNCINYADITSDVTAGGFVGTANAVSRTDNTLTIYNCTNYGNVYTTTEFSNGTQCAGGFIGLSGIRSATVIDRCANYGNVTVNGTSSRGGGGLVGDAHNCLIYNSFNSGDVYCNSANFCGGIVGHYRTNTTGVPFFSGGSDVNYYPSQYNGIENSYNTGRVTGNGSDYTSGICGLIQEASTDVGNSRIKNVYNFGEVSGSKAVASLFTDTECLCENAFAIQGTNAINRAKYFPSNIGYYDSADRGGNVYTGTFESTSENISSTPDGRDLRTLLDDYADEKNEQFEAQGDTFRYLPWTMSEGADPHPVFGYEVTVETDEASKDVNGGYVIASDYDIEIENFPGENTVTLTAIPETGYTLKSISAYDSANNEVTLTSTGTNEYTFTMPEADVVVTAEFESAEDQPYNAYYLTVSDNVVVNFIIDTEYYEAEDGYLEYEYIATIEKESAERTDEPERVDVSTLTKYSSDNEYDGDRQLILKAAPAQIGEKYLIKVFNKNGVQKAEFTRSIEDYCKATMDREDYFGELSRTILNYGQLANEYFEYAQKHKLINGDDAEYNIQTVGDYKAAYTSAEVSALMADAHASIDHQGSVGISGVTYIAQLDPEFRFYLSGVSVEQAANLSVSVTGGLSATIELVEGNEEDEENNICVSVKGLYSSEFRKSFTVTVGDTQITYNGYAYIATILNDSTQPESLKAMMRGVYRYARASENAYGTHIH